MSLLKPGVTESTRNDCEVLCYPPLLLLQHVDSSIWWYYMIELGFYFSLLLSLFMDIKRKVRDCAMNSVSEAVIE